MGYGKSSTKKTPTFIPRSRGTQESMQDVMSAHAKRGTFKGKGKKGR